MINRETFPYATEDGKNWMQCSLCAIDGARLSTHAYQTYSLFVNFIQFPYKFPVPHSGSFCCPTVLYTVVFLPSLMLSERETIFFFRVAISRDQQ